MHLCFNQDVTVPTRLENTSAGCDYLLKGQVYVKSKLVIDPGVVVVAQQDSGITVKGGEIQALGTPQQRIVMQGLNAISGYWDGIDFDGGRPSAFDYFDLKDAGQNCTIRWCADAALIFDNVAISFSNSTVSNSYVHGLHMTGDVVFTKFENNRFYGNTWAGIVIDGNYAPVLDAASDYSGGAEPNGNPYILVAAGTQVKGEVFRWKKLNTPYFIGNYFNVEGGTLVLEPGVEMVLNKDASMWVKGNGVLSAIGTAADPIIFRGHVEQPGYWDGIRIYGSPWEKNRLEYVHIRHSGNVEGLTNAYGAVRLNYSGRVHISNSVIEDNAKYGVACDEQSYWEGYSPVLTLGPGNTFNNNGSGDIDPVCQDAMNQ